MRRSVIGIEFTALASRTDSEPCTRSQAPRPSPGRNAHQGIRHPWSGIGGGAYRRQTPDGLCSSRDHWRRKVWDGFWPVCTLPEKDSNQRPFGQQSHPRL